MPPVQKLATHSSVTGQPLTWDVIQVVSGSAWFTYTIYSSASQIWHWIQKKLEAHNQNAAMKAQQLQKAQIDEVEQRLHQRDEPHSNVLSNVYVVNIQLQKRWTPFGAVVNAIYWSQKVVKWIYAQADHIPHRIQIGVDHRYTAVQNAKWEVKNEEADHKVKTIMAKEFPEFYAKKHLDPYEQGSELHTENTAHLGDALWQEWSSKQHVERRARHFDIADEPLHM